jgi:hypothetical protein
VAHRGDLDAASQLAATACRFDRPLNTPNPLSFLGVLDLRLGHSDRGRTSFEQSILLTDRFLAACPDNWEVWFAKGLALAGRALGRNDRALACEAAGAYRRAREIAPNAGLVPRARLQLDILAPADAGGLLAPIADILTRPT